MASTRSSTRNKPKKKPPGQGSGPGVPLSPVFYTPALLFEDFDLIDTLMGTIPQHHFDALCRWARSKEGVWLAIAARTIRQGWGWPIDKATYKKKSLPPDEPMTGCWDEVVHLMKEVSLKCTESEARTAAEAPKVRATPFHLKRFEGWAPTLALSQGRDH